MATAQGDALQGLLGRKVSFSKTVGTGIRSVGSGEERRVGPCDAPLPLDSEGRAAPSLPH